MTSTSYDQKKSRKRMKRSIIAAALVGALASELLTPAAQADPGVTLLLNGKNLIPPNFTPTVACNMGNTQATRLNTDIMISGPSAASGVADLNTDNQVIRLTLSDGDLQTEYGLFSANAAQDQAGPITAGDDATVTKGGLSYKITGHASRLVKQFQQGGQMVPTGSPMPFEFDASGPHALTPMRAQ